LSTESDIASVLEEIRAATAEIRETTAETKAEAERDREQYAEAREGLEKERRDGVHGSDWKVLQQRIDMKRTTESDIVNGIDHSQEARAVREQIGRGLVGGRTLMKEELLENEDQLDDLRRAQEQLAQTIQRLSELNRNL
jgi:hypothetical protein